MTTIVGVAPALPPHRYAQAEMTEMFAALVGLAEADRGVLEQLHHSARVETRHLVLPKEQYADLDDFGKANDAFLAHATELGSTALLDALARAGLQPTDVDLIITATVTGVAAPSLDARIAQRIGLRPDVRRVPLFGLGCVAGAAGIARLHDHLVGHPDQVAVLVSVELCSLTVQRDDVSMANLVASGLFGDGASAVVAMGSDRAARTHATGPVVLDSRSRLYPDSLRTMGWDVGSGGLKIVLDPGVPQLIEQHLADDAGTFLADHGLTPADIGVWVSHPGGPKVIEAIERALALPDDALRRTWESLARVGNLSSSSVLHVLHDTIAQRPPGTGEPAVLMAMGPGFCAELVLLRW